ncbi:ABC transporter ATP-binding protein [Actinophytocola gossypii]|uniref:ATP-binding cassette domain-containing protein n=1 Tax=Actinophytocola gossypii TaxID=2812003 RepID=A0ABT2JK18_9PSEU|nr:ATP-binding cassette domain-containing protein [Actinophytocola gossypii]MCT2588239.1 ATP-binding cassette domain-containing protein [Actinophytocola gossypii]
MIELRGLTKRHGGKLAVDQLSFDVRPGRVTGFLGPNGAGKSTTMRMILGLDEPTEGGARVNGRPYRRLPAPLREVGALLDARAVHGGRTAYDHLRFLAVTAGIPRRRITEVVDLVGLTAVARSRAKEFSLGMAQRLGIAAALLGDPGVLILDEPINGLDTEGIRWLRGLLTGLAGEGRTVLLSSHVMSEMELTADHLVVIGQGRLLADMPMRAFIAANSETSTVVRATDQDRLSALLRERGATIRPDPGGGWIVGGLDATAIGELANAQRLSLRELTPRYRSLEEVYTRMTRDAVEYRTARHAIAGGTETSS